MSLSSSLVHQSKTSHGSRRISGLRRQTGRPRAGVGHAEDARPSLEYVLDDVLRPSSELDEARRRVKRNVQEIEGQLRLGGRRSEAVSTEATLTEMTRRLQSMAAYQRTIVRSGQFDEVDLAIYLKQTANFLCRPRGRSPEPECISAGGWAFTDSGTTLSWTRGSRGDAESPDPGGLDLSDAIRFMEPHWREAARRAVCACAVMFPPGPFNWLSWFGADPADNEARPGDLGIRLRLSADSLLVQVWVADRSLGLPRNVGPEGRTALGRQLSARLQDQTRETLFDPSSVASFEVTIVSAPPASEVRAAIPALTLA